MKVLRVFALILITANLALADDPFAESNSLLSAAAQHRQSSSVPPYTLARLQEMAMVVPEPHVGSSTRSPGSLAMRMQRWITLELVCTT